MKFEIVCVAYGKHPIIPQPCPARIIYIENSPEHNLGWVKGANRGLKESTADYVVLMNDDVEVLTENWLEKLAVPFSACVERIGCVGPHGGRGFQSRIEPNTGVKLVAPELSLNSYGIGNFPLSFFCIMFSRECLRDVALLDERFSPAYGEDDDWLCRAHLRGWKMAIQTDVQVKHEGGRYGGKRSELGPAHAKLLQEKWRDILTERVAQ